MVNDLNRSATRDVEHFCRSESRGLLGLRPTMTCCASTSAGCHACRLCRKRGWGPPRLSTETRPVWRHARLASARRMPQVAPTLGPASAKSAACAALARPPRAYFRPRSAARPSARPSRTRHSRGASGAGCQCGRSSAIRPSTRRPNDHGSAATRSAPARNAHFSREDLVYNTKDHV